jgi:hypothetical protein
MSFTPRQFPTPLRESLVDQEDEACALFYLYTVFTL